MPVNAVVASAFAAATLVDVTTTLSALETVAVIATNVNPAIAQATRNGPRHLRTDRCRPGWRCDKHATLSRT
jgi:hypothetical protein